MPKDATSTAEGQAYLEFDLKVPNQAWAPGTYTLAPESSQVLETVFGSNETTLAFRVTTPQFLDRALKALGANGNPIVRWRIGLGTGPQINWIPWQTHYVTRYAVRFEGGGTSASHYVKLFTRDLLHLANRSSRTQAHRGTISSIIKQLAATNGLSNTVVEETLGEAIWIQSYEGDFEFARKRLVARARSQRGRGNYYLYVRDDALHFHTVEHQTEIIDLDYYLSPATGLDAVDMSQDQLAAGAAGVRVIYHDPYSGESKQINSDPNKAIRMANSIPRLDKIAGAARNILEHRAQIRDEESGSAALAQNAYEAARAECFQIKIQTSRTFFLRPGQLLRLSIDPSPNNTSVWSGVYLIVAAAHDIDSGKLNSVYTIQRGEQRVARSKTDNLAAYGTDTLQDEQNAPGYDINMREAQSSSLTKGAGKAGTEGAYRTVQNKSAAVVPAKPDITG